MIPLLAFVFAQIVTGQSGRPGDRTPPTAGRLICLPDKGEGVLAALKDTKVDASIQGLGPG